MQRFRRYVTDKRVPWVTIALITVLVLVWLGMLISAGSVDGTTNPQVLEAWGAAVRPVPFWSKHQFWRLLTAVFVHIGPLHLAVNAYSLWILGRSVEYLFGRWRTLYIFLVAGVAGSVASAIFGPALVISAGASGAIFGLLGAIFWFRLASPLGNSIAWRPLLFNLGLNLAIGLSLHNFIDNWAHVGGLVGGALAAYAIGFPARTGRDRYALPGRGQYLIAAGVGLMTVLLVAGQIDLPGNGRDLYRAADAFDAGRYAEAVPVFQRISAQQPDEPWLHYVLAVGHAQLKQCDLAKIEAAAVERLTSDPEMLTALHGGMATCGK
jgi:rhomboid protease GluP